MNRKIVGISIVIFFISIIPLSYVHELGHSYICMMEGYTFDIKLSLDGGRMICHGEVENDILFDKMSNIFLSRWETIFASFFPNYFPNLSYR